VSQLGLRLVNPEEPNANSGMRRPPHQASGFDHQPDAAARSPSARYPAATAGVRLIADPSPPGGERLFMPQTGPSPEQDRDSCGIGRSSLSPVNRAGSI